MSSSFKRLGAKKATTTTKTTTSSVQPAPTLADFSSSSPHQRTVSSSILPGTRPWTSNLTVTSFGLREIDSFLFSPGGGEKDGGGGGGGQPLQSLVLLEEDRLADDLSRALCRYWCAEGVAQRQLVILPSLLPSADESLQLFDDDFGSHTINNEGSSPKELHDFVVSLPRNLHLDKLRSKAATTSGMKTCSGSKDINNITTLSNHGREAISAIVEEDEHDEDDYDDIDDITHGHGNQAPTTTSDEGLINAWQYRTSIQVARSGIGKQSGSETAGQSAGDGIYCHSYNLSQRMWDQFSPNDALDDNPLLSNTRIIDCASSLIPPSTEKTRGDKSMHNQHQGMALFCSIWNHLQSELSTHRNRVIRLFIHRLPVGQGSVAMPLLMAKIRKDNLPVVVLATICPWRWLTSSNSTNSKIDSLHSLRNTADTSLSLDSFSSLRTPPPPEFSLLQGILTVHKCASSTTSHYTDTVTNKRPLADRFGVKRDGRKVTVQLLHLPPEEYSKGGSSTGGGDRSGGGNITATFTASTDGSNSRVQHYHENDNMNTATPAMGCSSFGGGGPSLEF